MKQMIFPAILLLATTINATAQSTGETNKTSVHFGARVGANLSNLIKSDDADVKTGSKIGLNAAVFVELPLAPVFSIQPEVQFSQKGFKETGTALGAAYEYKQTTNFIEIPLLAKFKPVPSFGIVVGPQFSFLASTSVNFKSGDLSYQNVVKENNDNLRKNIFGGVIGVEAGAKNFVAALRYNLDFQNNNGDGTSSTPKYKNQVIALSVGVIF